MSKIKHLRNLPVARLREFFSYNPHTGELRYRPNRARKWFKSERLWLSWNAQFGGKIASARHGTGYECISVNQRYYLAHRVIWAMMTGVWPKEEIDHINQNRADNRWYNLRAATRGENARNISMPSNNTSGVMGVHWFKRLGIWQVYGGYKGGRIVKYAKTFDEAVVLRERIKQQLGMTERHGERRS
jgi:hypothetical protein